MDPGSREAYRGWIQDPGRHIRGGWIQDPGKHTRGGGGSRIQGSKKGLDPRSRKACKG